MPVSPNGVSGILLFIFGTVELSRSFQALNFPSWNTDGQSNWKPHKTLSALQACSFFLYPFWNSALDTRFFVHHIVPQVALEPEILWKSWFAWAFSKHFFICYAIFTWIWTYKSHDLTGHQLIVGSFLPAIVSMGRTKQTPRWPRFFEQRSFHSVPSSAGFIRLILLLSLVSLLLDFPCASQCDSGHANRPGPFECSS